jgi:hypothetical protein
MTARTLVRRRPLASANVRSAWLITQRSQVQILPPLPGKVQVRGLIRDLPGRAFDRLTAARPQGRSSGPWRTETVRRGRRQRPASYRSSSQASCGRGNDGRAPHPAMLAFRHRDSVIGRPDEQRRYRGVCSPETRSPTIPRLCKPSWRIGSQLQRRSASSRCGPPIEWRKALRVTAPAVWRTRNLNCGPCGATFAPGWLGKNVAVIVGAG